MSFVEDKNIEKVANAYALDAIEVARDNFRVSLDWSESSIMEVERILDKLHKRLLENRPSEEVVLKFSKIFGSYIGEVYRRNHKANWGMITLDNDSFPGLQCDGNQFVWPWSKVNNRIVNGSEDNIFDYYQSLT